MRNIGETNYKPDGVVMDMSLLGSAAAVILGHPRAHVAGEESNDGKDDLPCGKGALKYIRVHIKPFLSVFGSFLINSVEISSFYICNSILQMPQSPYQVGISGCVIEVSRLQPSKKKETTRKAN